MATLGASMVTLLTDNWAGAGAAPTFGFLIDYQKELADTTEQVLVRLPIHEDVDPINDTYSNFKFTIQLRVKTTVDEDRLKVLTDETIRILNTYAITGITRQFAKRGENTSDRKRQIFSYDVWAILEEHMSTAGTSYSSPGAGDVPFPRDVSIARDLAVTRNVTIGGTLEVTGVTTLADESLTSTQIADLLMFGSGNAAWVPCVLGDVLPAAFYIDGNGHVVNIDNTNGTIYYTCPLPTTKGGLKLYITGTRVSLADADANNKVDTTYVFGYTSTVRQTLDSDATDKTSVGLHTDTFGAVDASGHQVVKLCVSCINTNADALGVQYMLVQCYYAA